MIAITEYAALSQSAHKVRDALACLFFAAPDLTDFDQWVLWKEIIRECQFLTEKAREQQLKNVNATKGKT